MPILNFQQEASKLMEELTNLLIERYNKYGDFETVAKIFQNLEWANTEVDQAPAQAQITALSMINLKIARLKNNSLFDEDTWIDIMGYAALAIIAKRRRKQGAE